MFADQFFIDVPLILIRTLNTEGHFVPDTVERLFDPVAIDEDRFEEHMVAMRILRGNLIAATQKYCKVSDLYQGAIGHHEDLNRVIPIAKIGFCRVAGASAGSDRDLIVKYPPTNIPVQGSSVPVDVSLGTEALLNVKRASSGDAIIGHPRFKLTEDMLADIGTDNPGLDGHRAIGAIYEFLQMKSSDVIRNGRQIDPTSKAVLFTYDIRKEAQKISDEQHCTFCNRGFRLLVVISNKPLASVSGSML